MASVLGLEIDWGLDEPFFTGTTPSGSSLVPGVAQVSIGGHPYVIDPKKYQRSTVPVQRQSLDESVEPGEQTLNVGGAWRRSQDNWFMGAGQLYLDNRFAFVSVYTNSGEDPSVRTRFWRSKGVNPWHEGGAQLLTLQENKGVSASTSQLLCAVGTTLFWWDGTNLKSSANPGASPPTWTTITAPLSLGSWPTITSLTTDGVNLYAALGSYGVCKVTSGTATILRPTPTGLAVANIGTPGAATDTYFVVATDANGYKSLVSAQVQTTTANATLNNTNYNVITWTAVPGAVSYDVLKTNTSTFLGTTTTPTFSDQGQATSAYTAPTNTTQWPVVTFAGYGNGFLLAGAANQLLNVGSNGMTTLVMKHFNPSFVWNALSGSPSGIYVAGNAGNNSELYAIQLSTTTFGLQAPFIAGSVQSGEIINDICYYQGIVVLSTSLGARTAQVSGTNSFLTMGPVINAIDPLNPGNTDGASLCNAAYGNYVWFGISNFNENDGIYPNGSAVTSGLARLFLSEFSQPLLPAYTSDVMTTNGVTGTTLACAIVNGSPFFVVSGSGVWGPVASGNTVAYGYIQTGWVRYGTIEEKILIAAEVKHDPLPTGGSVTLDVVPFEQGNPFRVVNSNVVGAVGPNGPVGAGNDVGEAFHVVVTINQSGSNTTGPILRRWTTRAMVVAVRQDQIIVPLVWADEAITPMGDGAGFPMDLVSEWQYLKLLEKEGGAFIYQEGSQGYTCYVDQIEMSEPYGWNDTKQMLEGVLLVKLLTLA